MLTDGPGQRLWERVKRGIGKPISPLIPRKKRISIVYREIISLTKERKFSKLTESNYIRLIVSRYIQKQWPGLKQNRNIR